MMEPSSLGRLLIFIGAVVLLAGVALVGLGKWPGLGWLGRLPGDIAIERRNFRFYFPLTTGLLISLILSALFYFLGRR